MGDKELILDGSEAPIKVEAEALLASEKLVPVAVLNKIRVPYQPVDVQLKTLSTGRDRLLSGKQILALTLTYKFKLEDAAEVKPYIPLLNNRIYDTKFESQFYMISDANKRVYAMGDVYPESSKLPKGEYKLQLYLRHENVQLLEKLKQLTVFIERNMGEIRLNLHSEPDGPVTGNGVFKSSVLMPGVKEAFYLGPPTKDKLPKNTPQGSVLVGEISYGKLSFDDKEGKNPKDNPVFYPISFVVPPKKPDEDKKAVSSTNSCKSVSERLEQEVRDTKIKFLGNLKQETEEERSEWKKLCACLKSEYPSNTPLLAKILEGLLSLSEGGDKISHHEEIIDAANEVVRSVDVDELARFLLDKSEPEDEEAENLKKKMEMTRDQLAEALYQKGLAMARIENLKGEKEDEGDEGSCQKDKFEENFKELTKWVLEELIQNENQTANKKLYELKLGLLEELGEEMKNMYTAMIRVPYQPVDAQLKTLSTGRDRLLSGKQILALTLTYKFKLEDAAEVKPYIPLLNNRIYDTKFESQFYMISDANKRVYAMGDVYPESSKLPKGEYKVQLYLRHENVQLLEKLKQLTVFIERNMGEVRLNLHSEPDGPVTGNGALKSSVLMPGVKEAFYVGPPTKDKLPKNTPQGSVLVGEISYGKLSFDDKEGKNPKDNPAFYPISYVVPPNKPEEDKKAVSSTNSCKSVSERLEQEVRDTKIKFLGNLKQETEEERSEWKKLCACLKSEYPSYTPLLAKILEGLLSRSEGGDKISHHEEIIDAANEVVRSVDVDELARFLLDKSEPEDEEAEGEKEDEGSCQKDKFEENFKELTKWVDVKSSKFGTLTVLREKRLSRLGSALKVLEELIQNENQTANKKLYELKLGLLEELGWSHLATYEKQWMQVRFPTSLPLF
ncbi:hypothetical protein F2Q68_00037221 [Brassica cretica]|uniref:Tripeptidyl peptidase II second Ig-like domain-containing protein n=1 Tax=Brassica cretica TaxID=69181 RepID=A0A8S9H6E5_BRACR|nr:hypothetical protein F2Q68_00037221 [Brassica cretica]